MVWSTVGYQRPVSDAHPVELIWTTELKYSFSVLFDLKLKPKAVRLLIVKKLILTLISRLLGGNGADGRGAVRQPQGCRFEPRSTWPLEQDEPQTAPDEQGPLWCAKDKQQLLISKHCVVVNCSVLNNMRSLVIQMANDYSVQSPISIAYLYLPTRHPHIHLVTPFPH